MSYVILVTGGIKSGKSEFAEYLASKEKNVTYIALSENHPNDEIWNKKILLHQSRRPKSWKLIETNNLIPIIKVDKGILLIDSLGGFIVNNLRKNDDEWKNCLNDLLHYIASYKSKMIIVGEQTGWGLVSEYEIGNLYTDRLGVCLKEITKISKENWITINGKAIKLDNMFFEIPK
tara:strand:+ start:1029 stop:1556 length:528 start_codon:yes stop_codon:yes gene_type:complete